MESGGPPKRRRERLEAANIGDLLNSGFRHPESPGRRRSVTGMVFVGLMDGHVAAIKQKTGELVWATQIGYTPPKTGQAVSGDADLRARHASSPASPTATGRSAARSSRSTPRPARCSGSSSRFPVRANRDTTPGPAATTRIGDIWKQGGAGVWHAGTVDVDLGLVYFVTGNAVPMFGGEARKGDNLYTASLLALDMKTGKLRWHYQVVHHDLWDADIAIPPILYDAQVNGRPRKAIAAMRADGYLFLLDRETGKPLLPIEERR